MSAVTSRFPVWRMASAFALAAATWAACLPTAGAQDAASCVHAVPAGDRLVFSNHCGGHVYVLWCGALKYASQRCAEGPKGGYYTHSTNMEAGASRAIDD